MGLLCTGITEKCLFILLHSFIMHSTLIAIPYEMSLVYLDINKYVQL
jgi:hypothetical protein